MDTSSYLSAVVDEAAAQNAIEIAPRVWWVGHYLEGDPFQCHVYLLEHGDQSMLFDPGSSLTVHHTLRKIAQVTDFDNIRYFVCHHQDPDITGAMPLLDGMVTREDAVLVTHWRAQALLKHYALKMPFWLVDQHDWHLDLGGPGGGHGGKRMVRFAFTPYAHFPGAFVSFDETSGTLFSSDLFGGFTEGFTLVAQNEDYFEAMRPFHEHYMPSRDILQNAMRSVRQFPIQQIAPQHGSIIPEPLVDKMIDRLSDLDCGLYLLSREDTDIRRLMDVNQALRDINQTMTDTRDFPDIAQALSMIFSRFLPLESLDFYVNSPTEGVRVFYAINGYLARPAAPEDQDIADILNKNGAAIVSKAGLDGFVVLPPSPERAGKSTVVVPLGSYDPEFEDPLLAVAVLKLDGDTVDLRTMGGLVSHMAMPLQVAIDREILYQNIDTERLRFFERANRDHLTGLYSRIYMQETMLRTMDAHDRNASVLVGAIVLDLDFFKRINDTFGHVNGDEVLRKVGATLMADLRPSDLPVRLGGEEFAIFTVGISQDSLMVMANRLLQAIRDLDFDGPMKGEKITASFGVALRYQKESFEGFLERADDALYDAKRAGRDRVYLYAPCG